LRRTAFRAQALAGYNVYRNNVTVSLIDALVAIYPAVQRITGGDFFRAMARF
jgi:putative DNA-binding protein